MNQILFLISHVLEYYFEKYKSLVTNDQLLKSNLI